MKKLTILFLNLLVFFTVFSQENQELFLNSTWYLSRIKVDNEIYYATTSNIILDYTLINYEQDGNTHFTQSQCSDNTAEAIYTFLDEDTINISSYAVTSTVCPLEEVNTFFNFLNYNIYSVNESLNFQYSITQLDSNLELMMKAPNGNAAYYFNVTTANTKLFNNELLKVYPNPTSDFLNVSISDLDKIEIFDILGKRIYPTYNSTENGTQIDIQQLARGNYILQISKGDQTENIKFIKE